MLNTPTEVKVKGKELGTKNYEFNLLTEPYCVLIISKGDLSIALPLDVEDLNLLTDLLMEAVSQQAGRMA